jgi:uncharacterized protein YidB (DUF937 family)
MSWINTLAGVAGQLLGGQQQNNPLMGILAQVLGGQGGGQAAGGNPLQGLLAQFQQAGLGETMQSWIGTGQNQPISPDALSQVFGQQRVDAMAQQAGMDSQGLLGQLAELLPGVVDRMTPQGQIPEGNAIQEMLAGLMQRR